MLKALLKSFLALALLLSATSGPACAGTLLNGAGATFPYPLYSKWFKDYQAADSSVSFNYQATGSGDGIKKIMAKSVDFGASDKFLSDEELKAATGKLLHIPTVLGAVAVTYNIPGIGSGLRLTPQAVAGIYLGKITRWNDPTLARLNQKLKLPEQDIVVVHRSDGSGTTSIFTDYLSSVDAVWAKRVGKGTSVAWPTGVGAKGSSEVVNRIKGTPYSIGYAEIAYAIENDLSTAVLKNRSGQFVKPNVLSTRAAAVHAMEGEDRSILDPVQDELVEKDYRISLVNKPGRDVYPIVGLTWLLVYQQQEDAVKGKKLVEFLMWELRKAEKMTSMLYYTPLPKKLADQVEKTIKSIRIPE